jgi:hypothetical protein
MSKHILLILVTCFAFAAHAQEDQPKGVTISLGELKIGALMQFWGQNDSTNSNFNYRLRRAELKLNGSVVQETRWFLMIDPAKSLRTGAVAAVNDNKILQDFGVGFMLTPELELLAGQFKTPTTAEGSDSSADLFLPERSYSSRAFGDRRESGLMLTYKLKSVKVSVMSSNGQATNVDDTNNSKDLHARVDASLSDEIKVGVFTTAGDASYNNKARWGTNARIGFGRVLVRLEGVRARDATVWSTGWSADISWQTSEHWQPVIRFDGIENTFTASAITGGVNYLLSKNNAKIQAAYSQLRNMSGSNGSYAPSRNVDGNVAIVSFQQAL